MGVSGMEASGVVGSWSVGGRIIANVGLIYNSPDEPVRVSAQYPARPTTASGKGRVAARVLTIQSTKPHLDIDRSYQYLVTLLTKLI